MLMAVDRPLTVVCFDSLADCGVGETEWDDFHIRQRAEIFHSYHWVRTWLATYGGGRTLRLFIIRRGDALAGILPLFYEDHWWFASGSRVAKQVCADFGIASLSLPIEPDALRPALEAVLNHLFRVDSCHAVQFGSSIGQPEIGAILGDIARRNSFPPPEESPSGTSSQLSLPDSFEAYLASLSRNHRQNFRRTWNRLTRELNCAVEVISDEAEALAVFGDFVEMHAQQWQARGEGGHFSDWPRSLQFHQALLQDMARRGRLLMVLLRANGRPISYQYCYGLGERLFWLLPARLVSDEWERHGLGRVGFVIMAEAAIQHGYREIDLGGAYWQYKSDLGGEERPSSSILVCRDRVSRGRALWLRLYATALDIPYYRLWFKRIAPRMAWRRGALWPHWVRVASFIWRRR